jgi:hypothetical protein
MADDESAALPMTLFDIFQALACILVLQSTMDRYIKVQ